MEDNFVVEAVCSSLDMSVEEAQQLMFESEGQGFARLKVNELKNIIRDLKAQGYSKVHLSVTANKPALVDMLRAVAAAEKVTNAPSKVPQIAQATPQAVPLTHGAQLPPRLMVPAAAAPGASRAANQPLSVLVPGPFSPPPQTHTAHRPNASNTQANTPHLPAPAPSTASKSKKNKPKPASTHPGHTYIPKPGDDPNLQARLMTVLTSGHKIQAYKILKEVEGVTEKEILTELEGHSNVEALDVDELMFSIVMKRESATPGKPRHPLDALHPNQGLGEGEEGEEEYDALLEQENRDMDAAIRESEKERDVIQQRKRARVEALRQGQDGFLASGEYQGSVLLFGCPGLCNDGDGGDGGGSDSNGGGTTEEVQKGGGGGGGSGTSEDKSSGDGGGTTKEVQRGGASSIMAVNGSTSSGGSVVRNTLTKQVLHNSLPTTSTTLHRSLTNTSTHSHSTNSDSSASSYAYSSAGGGYNSSSSVGTSSSNRNNSTNIGNTNNKGSNSGNKGGNNSSSSVVDLTLDSESDSEPIVRKAVASTSSGGGSGSSNSMGNRTLTNGSCGSSAHNFTANRIPLATTTTTTKTTTNTNNTNNTNSVPPNTANTTNPTNNTTELNKKPNMSRSVVVSTFARLLDELHSMQDTSGNVSGSGGTIGSSGSGGTSGSSGSSANTTTTATNASVSISTSSGSSSGIRTKPINLHNRVYDIIHLSHCSPHYITLLTTLRTSLSRILLLESNASKFYKNTSTAYMVYTARRIDGKLLCDSVDQAVNSTFDTNTITTSNTSATNTTSTTYADDCIYHLHPYYIRHTTLVALLAHESDKLEKGMYKLQTDGSLVPYIFKKPRLAYYARVLAASIDTDGMEVVDVGGGSDSVSGGGGGSGDGGTSNATLIDTSNTSNTAEPVDCCMWASSDESVASEYNSDEDDF